MGLAIEQMLETPLANMFGAYVVAIMFLVVVVVVFIAIAIIVVVNILATVERFANWRQRTSRVHTITNRHFPES